jgi:hypothetical protein
LVGLDDVLGCALDEDIQVEVTSDRDETQSTGAIRVELKYRGHGCAVSEKDANVSFVFFALKHDEGVHTGETRAALTVVCIGCLPRSPHVKGTGLKFKFSLPITEAVYILRGKLEIHLYVLICEYESLIASIEEPVGCVDHIVKLEPEVFLCLVIQLEAVEFQAEVKVRFSCIYLIRGYVKPSLIGCGDSKVEGITSDRVQLEGEVSLEVIISSEKVLVAPVDPDLLGDSIILLKEKLSGDYLRGLLMQNIFIQVHQYHLTEYHVSILGRPL